MAKTKGIAGCAVVEIDAGMVWHAAGNFIGLVQLAEAASDYWRLNQRIQSNFSKIGELMHCNLVHASHQIRLDDCGLNMIFITLAEASAEMDWDAWKIRIQQLTFILEAN